MERVREAWRAALAVVDPDPAARPDPTDDLPALKKSQQGAVRALFRALDQAKEAREAAARGVTAAESELATVRAGLEADTAELTTLQGELERRLEELGLSSIRDLAERRLAEDVLRDGRVEVERLQKSVAETKTRLETLRREQKAHADGRPDPFELEWMEGEPTPDACAAALDDLSRQRIELNERVTQARSLLLEAQRVAEDIAAIRAARDDAGARAEVWHQLHDLIGVNDGDRFREFAQALNLDRLLDRANQHLATLKDRYRLVTVRDPETGVPTLEFEVEDRWRPGTTRSLKTLSGGEGFLVSLALALGLSDLRTSSMPVETLLLDEGFGTLDPETLDVALAALQQLQASGRQIGIISHVAGLQERIDARIQVEPLGNGRSRVSALVEGV
jgi:exonuclease SbcC